MDELAAIEFLLDKMKDTKTNSGILRGDEEIDADGGQTQVCPAPPTV